MISSSIIVLGVIGIIAAVLLFWAAKKFRVDEDPRILEIEDMLPGANCGGCGLSGCHAFAVACVKEGSLDNLNCVGVTSEDMVRIGSIIGAVPPPSVKRRARMKCQADCTLRDVHNHYAGTRSCLLANNLYMGETDCLYGCLGCGDCVRVCPFDALSIPEGHVLPVVDPDRCTACGRCVGACPRNVIEIAEIHPDENQVWVACGNKDRAPLAMKECSVACIGCSKCVRTCKHEAVTVNSFLAHIDSTKCVGCGECVEACPRKSIVIVKMAGDPKATTLRTETETGTDPGSYNS
ncbi:MAG: RnfABCDGE type electron transport complex subunit B [Bacteroides sp.]|nr:RnfABCDGE type electron transport complex subunit B [Bacteroides sp.]